MCVDFDVDVSWIASALCCIGFLICRWPRNDSWTLRCYGMSATVQPSLRGLRQLNYDAVQVRSNPVGRCV
ncbi:MAG: hypothetical protein FWC76_02775 [Defluviitaleaceae bacterium]|nr:hypothetical protein [Defluviitaleaceae bacterium]